MREIRFRAWDGNKMWNDVGFYDSDCGRHIQPALPMFGGVPSFTKNLETVLMQFTGLHDKNGKEIFEGDLLSSCPIGYIPETRKPGEVCEVIWIEPKKGYHEDPSHGWKIKTKRGLTNITVWLHVTGCGYEEILGNIYENPELLK